jgi:predicted lipoprotein with Yx(FWY)xxD motif
LLQKETCPTEQSTRNGPKAFDRKEFTMMSARIFALGIGFGLLAAACGGTVASSGSAASSAPDTVSVRQVTGVGSIYTDASGMALYTPAEEATGKIMCTGSCTSIWIPLTAPSSGSLTGAPGVRGTLGVITRPDGTRQVTLNGGPLYRFFQDSAPGTIKGNGIEDSFNGVSFTWHVESGGGSPTTAPSASGYGY